MNEHRKTFQLACVALKWAVLVKHVPRASNVILIDYIIDL